MKKVNDKVENSKVHGNFTQKKTDKKNEIMKSKKKYMGKIEEKISKRSSFWAQIKLKR